MLLLADNLAGQLSTQSLPHAKLSSALPVTQLPAGSILWSDSELAALKAGQVVPLFTQDQVFFLCDTTGRVVAAWTC